MTNLQIRPVGGMWRVLSGTTVLAFATTYVLAQAKAAQLAAEGAAERVAQWRAAQCQR